VTKSHTDRVHRGEPKRRFRRCTQNARPQRIRVIPRVGVDVKFVAPREQGRAIFQKIRLARISGGDNKEVGLARKTDQRVDRVIVHFRRTLGEWDEH